MAHTWGVEGGKESKMQSEINEGKEKKHCCLLQIRSHTANSSHWTTVVAGLVRCWSDRHQHPRLLEQGSKRFFKGQWRKALGHTSYCNITLILKRRVGEGKKLPLLMRERQCLKSLSNLEIKSFKKLLASESTFWYQSIKTIFRSVGLNYKKTKKEMIRSWLINISIL